MPEASRGASGILLRAPVGYDPRTDTRSLLTHGRVWMLMDTARRFVFLSLIACVMLTGCKSVEPDYGRALKPGEPALQKLDRSDWPDLAVAARGVDGSLGRALQRSMDWFKKPSTEQFYPIEGITHEHAKASLYAFREALQLTTVKDFMLALEQEFDVYSSVGWDKEGTVLFTGYYSPEFRASATKTDRYRFPLYKRPSDLVSDPITGEVRGRNVAGNIVAYPKRAELEQSGMLNGLELVYLPSRLDAYIIEVNGSAKLTLTDGQIMHVGFAGTNGYDYTSIGRLLVERGVMKAHEVSLPSIKQYFQDKPEQLDQYIQKNDRFVFFAPYDGTEWPAGSLGFKAEPMRTLATDKDIFPRGGVLIVDVPMARGTAAGTDIEPVTAGGASGGAHFMLDQDTGGAIRAPGRADIYFGIGQGAEARAGRQAHEGRLYYLFLKPERVDEWAARMREAM